MDLKAAAVALPLLSTAMPALFISSFLVGALTPGMVAVAPGTVAEVAGPGALRSFNLCSPSARRRRPWRR
jgi:hypothetical protein